MKKKLNFIFITITIMFCSFFVVLSTDFKWVKLNGPKVSIYFPEVYTIAENSKGEIYVTSNNAGVFRSSDNGETWLKVGSFPNNVFAGDMVISPNDYIFTGYNNTGLWRSTDDGLTWYRPNKDILVMNDGMALITIGRGLSSTSNNILFIPTTDSLLRSKNFGIDWEKCEPTSSSLTPAITISLTDEIYTITYLDNKESIFSSTDYGDTWEFKSIIPAPIPSFIKAKNDTIFFGSEDIAKGGVYRSTDKGLTWTHIIKENKINFYNAAFADDGSVFFGTFGNGMYRLHSDGITWDVINDGLETKDYFIPSLLINKDGYIFIGTPYSGVFRSCLPVNQSEYSHIEAEGPNPNCDGIPVLLKATPEGDSYHYLWSTGETSPQIVADTTGTYILEVTYDFGCTSKDTLFVKVEPKFEGGITGDSIICNGEVITLMGEPFNASYKYKWSTGETQPLIKSK